MFKKLVCQWVKTFTQLQSYLDNMQLRMKLSQDAVHNIWDTIACMKMCGIIICNILVTQLNFKAGL